MKIFKKLVKVFVAVLMVMSFAGTNVNAQKVTVGTSTGNQTNLNGHTFKAYQVFTGTQADGSDELASIEWGSGIDGAAFLAALKADTSIGNKFTACTTAEDVAKVLSTLGDNSADAKRVAQLAQLNKKGSGTPITVGTTDLGVGYWLIVDETTPTSTENFVYNPAVLQLSPTVVINPKAEVPSSDKKVKDVNDSVANSESDWQDVADHDIGDEIKYKLTATIPADAKTYLSAYVVEFQDDMSKGLTFNPSSLVIKAGNTTVAATDYVSGTGTSTYDGGHLYTWRIPDVRGYMTEGQNLVITVEYTATLNENAKIGVEGNPNKSRIIYSNRPDQNQDGDPEGDTPWDNVVVFTYQLDVDKTQIDETTEKTAEEFNALDAEEQKAYVLVNGKYYKTKPLGGASFKLSKKNAEGQWVEVETIANQTTFSFAGLDDGDYKLEETVVPDGFNKAADIEFTVTANHEIVWTTTNTNDVYVDPTCNNAQITLTSAGTGVLATDVLNQRGTTLPETGGMGTTILYTIGGLLVLGAIVMLVTKKRMTE